MARRLNAIMPSVVAKMATNAEDGHCGEWLAKFGEQLAALDSGGDLTEVRTQANETVQKLASAIRKSFPT